MMRISAKLGLTALLAALLLAAAVSTASSRSIEVSNQNIRITWSRLEFQSEVVTVRCQLTVEGSFHSRTIAKVERSLVGAVTRALFKNETCTNGSASALRLPWHISYESFTGVLPNIATFRQLITRMQFGAIILGRTCLMGTATDRISVSVNIGAGGVANNLIPIAGANTVHLLEGPTGFLGCPSSGTLSAAETDGRVTLLNSTATISVRLI